MHCRLRHVVSTLAAIAMAGGMQAADEIALNTGRFTLRATVSVNELHTEGGVMSAGGRTVVITGVDREPIRTTARTLLANGEATRVDPVLYLDGQSGSPQRRVVATRRILLQAAGGQNPADLAAEHGLRLVRAIAGRPGWWIAEPTGSDLYAAVDAAAALSGDTRAAMAMPILQMPVTPYYTPTDPALPYQWHLSSTFPGINVAEVWGYTVPGQLYPLRGQGTNVAITDTGVQLSHPDLSPSARIPLSYDYFHNDADPQPATTGDNHGTSVAGMAAASGDNTVSNASVPLGVAGVAFKSGIIASKVLHDYDPNAIGASSLAPSDRMYDAFMAQAGATDPNDLTWANNNSWGPGGGQLGGPDALMLAGMEDATGTGRGRRGIPIIFACGNSGTPNPNDAQTVCAFDGFLNRFTIGVAALSNQPAGHKASYSSTGPNIITSAPGGDAVNSRTGQLDALVLGVSTTDRTGDNGYIVDDPTPLPPPADFNGDWVVVTTPATQNPPALPHPDPLPFENGDYVPPTYRLCGTSFAAPIVTGCATLMQQARPELSWRDVRQLLILRGQDQVPSLPPYVPQDPAPHDDWGFWRPNAANLNYNNWYGFGAVDMGRLIFGGTGAQANLTTTNGLDEPGALRWPLLPPMLSAPLTYSATFPLPGTGATSDATALFDAPMLTIRNGVEVNSVSRELVYDGRMLEGIGTRAVLIKMPIGNVPARFRVDTVELQVQLQGVGPSTYPSTLPYRGSMPGQFDWGQYEFRLMSPSGATCILGRQRPGELFSDGSTTPWTWTFSEVFHTNESAVEGDWTLRVIDEVNNLNNDTASDHDNWNPPEARVYSVKLNVYGHQTYAQPSLTMSSATGVASDSGDQVITLGGSGFAQSQGFVDVTQAYWYPDALTSTPVELPTTYIDDTHVRVTIPASVLPTNTPGQGFITIANPAVVVGRTATTAAAVDQFDNPYPTTPMPSLSASNPSRYMKRCVDGDAKRLRYSRPPTMTPVGDVVVKGKGTVTITTTVADPDVQAGLPATLPERLTVSSITLNPGMTGMPVVTQVTPDPNGQGVYTIAVPVLSDDSTFAMVQVNVTDGVTTTTRSFRIIHPTDLSSSGCGGGSGLALLGIPLGVWLIRRRKR